MLTLMNRSEEQGDFKLRSFRAHDYRVGFVLQLKSKDIFVTVGDGIDHRTPKERVNVRAVANNAANRLDQIRAEEQDIPQEQLQQADDEDDDDGESSQATIKIWHLNKLDREGNPMLMAGVPKRGIPIFQKMSGGTGGSDPAAVTAVAALEDMSLIAVGLQSGRVILFNLKALFSAGSAGGGPGGKRGGGGSSGIMGGAGGLQDMMSMDTAKLQVG
jgi:hypothetical protein